MVEVGPQVQNLVTVFIFANPTSGSCRAKKYLDLQSPYLQLYSGSSVFDVHIFNLMSTPNRTAGFAKLAKCVSSQTEVRVVSCGGDGTFVWVVEESLKLGIDIKHLLFCVMPFGSGNDLACAFGWKRDPPKPTIGQHLVGLKRSLEEWANATPRDFDLWEVTVVTKEGGTIGKIHKLSSGFERVPLKDDNGNPTHVYKRLMSNYFSIGVDARIGLGFDKRRSKSKRINRCIYGWEGLKKMCCLATPRVQEVVTSMLEGETEVVFTNEDLELGNPSVFVALNCRTYGGGDHYIWDNAKPSIHSVNKGRAGIFMPQNMNDGLLEFVVFPNSASLAFEQVKITNGQGRRLYQGEGPFRLNLRPPQSRERVYMEIDGEYFFVTNPDYVSITISDISRDRRLKTLIHC